MNKVVIISTVGLIYDGITSVLVSYLEAMNINGLEIYVVDTIRTEPQIKKKIENIGCHIVKLPSRRDNVIKYFFSLIWFIRKNKIRVIHAHGNSATLSIEMLAGLLGGCKKRIAHSHNTKCSHEKIDRMLRPVFDVLYTDALACGQKAGKWLFGEKEFKILRNGRNIEKYSFDFKTREEMQRKLKIQNKLIIGHVGGFFEQKNHTFLLEIFREIYKLESNSYFVLIGDGPLKNEIEELASNMGNVIRFIGTVDDVENYLQAMDGMLLPSLFEGLPLVTLEWQINGLPCLLADTVTKECAVTNTVQFESLERTPAVWAKKY